MTMETTKFFCCEKLKLSNTNLYQDCFIVVQQFAIFIESTLQDVFIHKAGGVTYLFITQKVLFFQVSVTNFLF